MTILQQADDYARTIVDLLRTIVLAHPELHEHFEKILYHDKRGYLHDSKFLIEFNRELLSRSRSQLRQDLFVLSELSFKKNGFFVEFGATNGYDLSNSYLLETEYGWNGILAEPAKIWHDDLIKNRRCKIDRRCVWSKTGEMLMFNEPEYAELSTIESFSDCDHHADTRKQGKRYAVETVSLSDLLEEHSAPQDIDYLSLDTEGSEFDILSSFDFSRYRIKIITCEHNFTPMRDKLAELLQSKGYERRLSHISRFDDWWVLKSS